VGSQTIPIFEPVDIVPAGTISGASISARSLILESEIEEFTEEVFVRINTIFHNIATGTPLAGEVSSQIAEQQFYNDLLTECSLDHDVMGTTIIGINCDGLVFLDMPFKDSVYKDVTVQLRTGEFRNTAETPSRYVIKVFQFGGTSEDQMTLTRYSDNRIDLKYGFVQSLNCTAIQSSIPDPTDFTAECGKALDLSTIVFGRLNDL